MNASLAKIDGSDQIVEYYYWSSSEANYKGAYNVMGVDVGNFRKYNYSNFRVRAVCAF